MNLRGSVVPIVDLRRRFEVAPKELGNARRILVLALGGGKTGFMVDGVSEVMRVPLDAIRPAPELSPEQMRLISRVANLDAEGRIILLVDPAQLLDQVEADVLASSTGPVSTTHRRLRDQASQNQNSVERRGTLLRLKTGHSMRVGSPVASRFVP